ncbi:MAG: XdhC family protein [Rhodothermales bacterium]
MTDLQKILEIARRLRAESQPFAVATVVRIGGSTYRRPGARMLIDASGQHWGTISGGCLEGEIAERAIDVIANGKAVLEPFNLADDDIVLGFGTGCDGIVHVLIEPAGFEDDIDVLQAIDECIRERRSGVLATVLGGIGPSAGSHYFIDDTGDWQFWWEPDDAWVTEAIVEAGPPSAEWDARIPWTSRQLETDSGPLELLLEQIRPPVRLTIYGDGHDVRAMVAAGSAMGWMVDVVGGKPAAELASRFPDASAHHFLMHPESARDILEPDERTAIVLMTHNFIRDRELLNALSGSDAGYIGLLGPAERAGRMISEIGSLEDDPRIFAPVGLDIGTETPEEIALATVAEIQSVMSGRSAGSLRDRNAPIHGEREPLR